MGIESPKLNKPLDKHEDGEPDVIKDARPTVMIEPSSADIVALSSIKERLGMLPPENSSSRSHQQQEGYNISKAHFQFERDRLATGLRKARKENDTRSEAYYQENLARLYEELPERTVEEVSKQTGALFVHTLIDEESPYSQKEITDPRNANGLDILLAFQPSVSASTILPGHIDKYGGTSGLWGQEHQDGVVLGGGQIGQVGRNDFMTRSFGLKERGSVSPVLRVQTNEELHQVAGKTGEDDISAYNELVVNEPRVIGYFKRGTRDSKGTIWLQDPSSLNEPIDIQLRRIKTLSINPRRFFDRAFKERYASSLEEFRGRVKTYREKLDVAKDRGLTGYVMTPDKRLFEVKNVNDNGSIEVGQELTVEIATQKIGVSDEKRKEIGEELLKNGSQLFRRPEDYQEAERIVRDLELQQTQGITDETRKTA